MSIPVLSGLPLQELAAALEAGTARRSLPRFRPPQIFKWIASGAASFDEMSDLPLALREELAGRFRLRCSRVADRREDADGTVKLSLALADGAHIKAVLLADSGGRRTACLSSQAGCAAGCVFCKTGSLGFMRDLSSAEIVEQFLLLREDAERSDAAATDTRDAGPRSIANIVVMGMGEPLLNLAELRRALAVITDARGMGFSKRRITVSTAGISDGITDLADKGPAVRLALSLTTADEALRRRLMPVTARHPLAAVKAALAYFQQRGGGRVTLEAVLLGGLNTGAGDAAAMADFARGIDAVVNLIPWNPAEGLLFDGQPLREPSAGEVAAFAGRLQALGLAVTRRFRKGRGVMGACGQLGFVPAGNQRQD
jgi:23S rRNA (adenine2503-C2)-methyltransferase